YNINVNFTLNVDDEVKKATRIKGLSTSNVFNNSKFDGVVVLNGKVSQNGFDFTKIDSRDIQSVSVLKDAAATSLYGDKGKNGVLIITTKNNDFRKASYTELKLDTNTPTLKIR
ncbi:MAG: hypothetical protein EOO95_17385, partial [Pedobacter sp.]